MPLVDVPEELRCPLSGELMDCPVLTEDGHTFQQKPIKRWLKQHSVSPVTGLPIRRKSVVPNGYIKKLALEFMAAKSVCSFDELLELIKSGNKEALETRNFLASYLQRTDDERHYTPLHWAAHLGHKQILEFLLEGAGAGTKLGVLSKDKQTLLHAAAHTDQTEVVRLLLDKKISINEPDKNGQTALHTVARAGSTEIAQLLLANGARADLADRYHQTPLHVAATKGFLAIVQLLIEHKSDVNGKSNSDRTPLYLAAREGHQQVVELLLRSGAEVDPQKIDDWTPLHAAASHGHTTVVRVLLDHKASVNARDIDHWTPLHWACEGKADVVELLLRAGADVNAVDRNLWTPLHVAVKYSHQAVIRLLMQFGADDRAVNSSGQTPIQVAENAVINRLILSLRRTVRSDTEKALPKLNSCSTAVSRDQVLLAEEQRHGQWQDDQLELLKQQYSRLQAQFEAQGKQIEQLRARLRGKA